MDLLVTDESEDTATEEVSAQGQTRKRGVKHGTKRGKYKRTGAEKDRVLAAAQNGSGDWRAVAAANGVSASTAYGWLRRTEDAPRKRGGARYKKLSEEHIDTLLSYLEENPLLSLKELSLKLLEATGLNVCTATIHKHLNGRMFTLKKVRSAPDTMNSEENRRKRAAYVTAIMEAVGYGKTVIYMDESNVNLFLRRNFGRSRRGTRCSVKVPTSKGRNVHIIGAVSQTGLVYWERRRGSFKKEDCQEWMRSMLRAAHFPMENILVVCDNAPCHTGLETVLEEVEFQGAQLLRMGPYSAPLNPIGEVWSALKADMKRRLATSMPSLLRDLTDDLTQVERRLRHLESVIDAAIPRITPLLCMNTCNHVQRHFAACLALRDLYMGDDVRQMNGE